MTSAESISSGWNICRTSILALIVQFFLATGDMSCTFKRPEPQPRPSGVPQSAGWVNGKQSGFYLDCTAGEKTNTCTVYSGTGRIEASGQYRLAGYNRAATRTELVYEWFDGDYIFLADNKRLEPVGPLKWVP